MWFLLFTSLQTTQSAINKTATASRDRRARHDLDAAPVPRPPRGGRAEPPVKAPQRQRRTNAAATADRQPNGKVKAPRAHVIVTACITRSRHHWQPSEHHRAWTGTGHPLGSEGGGQGLRDAALPARREHVDVPAAAARERQRNGSPRGEALLAWAAARPLRPLAAEPDGPRARGPRGAFGIFADARGAMHALPPCLCCPLVGATRAAARGLPPSLVRVGACPAAPPRPVRRRAGVGEGGGGGTLASCVGPGKAMVARWIRAEGPAAAPFLWAELGDQAMI